MLGISGLSRKLVFSAAAFVAGLTGLFAIAGRGPFGWQGYMRATASTTVDGLTDQLSQEVHDRKLQQDFEDARQDMIDRQVQLSRSKTQIAQLRADVDKLQAALERRQRLLAEAYPVLETAVRDNKQNVRFASTDFTLPDFQRELDDLLSMQDRDERQLTIKRDGLARLEKSEQEAEATLTEMRRALEGAEQEVAVLRTRREQAEMESQTLELVGTVSGNRLNTDETLGKSLTRLRDDVGRLEAQNEAKRSVTPTAERVASNHLTRSYTRLESLKKFHEQQTRTPATVDQPTQKPQAPEAADLGD